MEFLIGSLLTIVVLLLYDKYKQHKKIKHSEDERQKERERELQEHFNELMNYTPEKAYRKV